VPVVQDMLPTSSRPRATIKVVLSDENVAAGKMPMDRLDDACHDIPFLLRPVMSRPLSVKVVLNYEQRDVGDVVYSCKDFHEIRSRQY